MIISGTNISETDSNKIKSYIGFAIRAGRVKYGAEGIVKAGTARIRLICVRADISSSTLDSLDRFAGSSGIYIIVLAEDICAALNKPGVKALALTHPQLSKAITDCITTHTTI